MARKPTSKARALAVGQAMAEAALRRRRTEARNRQAALRTNRALVTRSITTTMSLTTDVFETTSRSAGVLVAEGDSWFDYPFVDVLTELEDRGFDVEAVAHRGDTVEDMAYSGGQLDAFSRRIRKVMQGGDRPRAILLSGGGNDLAVSIFT